MRFKQWYTAKRIHQRLREEHPETCNCSTMIKVKRFFSVGSSRLCIRMKVMCKSGLRNILIFDCFAFSSFCLWSEGSFSLTEMPRALELTMPLSVIHGTNYSTLMPFQGNENSSNTEYWKESLETTWNITNRDEYFSTPDEVCESGQSNSYTELQKTDSRQLLQWDIHGENLESVRELVAPYAITFAFPYLFYPRFD